MGYDDYDRYPEVPYYSLSCCECGADHGVVPSGINKWHVCNGCGAAYCPDCGRELPRAGLGSNRICMCGGQTRLV